MTFESPEYARIIIDVFAIIIFAIGIIFPIKNTIIPYWKKFGRPSTALFSRLLIRIFLLILVIFNLLFPLFRLAGSDHTVLRSASAPIYLIISLLYLHTYFNHPDKLNGL